MQAHAAASSKHLVICFTEPTTQPQQQWVSSEKSKTFCITAELIPDPETAIKASKRGTQACAPPAKE